MWEHVDSLLAATASSTDVLRMHRVELLEVRRRRAAGLALEQDLVADEARAAVNELAAPALLARVRAAWDGTLVLIKGPEVALDYGATGLRSYGDLDFLTDDAEAAQAALIAAGFEEVFDPEIYADIHHLRPLWWPGLPLVVELHTAPNWPERIPGPSNSELLAAAVPGRLGVTGIDALPAEHHTLLLAAHAWVHQPLGRLGNLIDVAVSLRRSDEAAVERLARTWGCSRMWRTTCRAVRAVVEGEGGSAAASLWARHLPAVRERTVLEWHLKSLLAPVWAEPRRKVPGAALSQLRAVRLSRASFAIGNARVPRSQHMSAMEETG